MVRFARRDRRAGRIRHDGRRGSSTYVYMFARLRARVRLIGLVCEAGNCIGATFVSS